ncbi:MAG TPA: molybdopterin-synthase adenylyltransferase MoeB [Burkholderiales bacterium]|nr:molybdopterin-synthase adenylyltransferase MoeB [Burkholderiales bacterium]
MNDEELLRYSRHILLDEIGVAGQQAILDAHILIVGAGGLGSAAALYLAASGVGHLSISDGDTVDSSNLQRQIIHRNDAIGCNKAESAARTLAALNPAVAVTPISGFLSGGVLEQTVAAHQIVIDASDNFRTRHEINRACVRHRKALVSGAAIRFSGQISVFDLRSPNSPCYQCLFPDTGTEEETSCAQNGVFSPLVGIIGAMQAAEALKLAAGAGTTLKGRLLLLDALDMQWRSIGLQRDPRCAACGGV